MSGPQIPATQIRGAAAGTGHGIIDSGWWDICKSNVNNFIMPTLQIPQISVTVIVAYSIYMRYLRGKNGPKYSCPSTPKLIRISRDFYPDWAISHHRWAVSAAAFGLF